jgi:glutathionylspermidine synthase
MQQVETNEKSYDGFAERIVDSQLITDPWIRGQQRFREAPLVIPQGEYRELCRAAESLAAVYDEVCRLCSDDPELLDSFFRLTPFQKAMWQATAPHWHGIARADLFVTAEGIVTTEINSDTPTGEAEAIVLNRTVRDAHRGLLDPNADLEERFCTLVDGLHRRAVGEGALRSVGIVYPTEFTEDLALIRLYRQWFEQRGYNVVLGSPYNLGLNAQGGLTLFDIDVSLVLRHYKTDWWGERQSAWLDDEYPDTQALSEALGTLLAAQINGKVAVVNPLGAVLPQNKRSMALMWEHIHRFSEAGQTAIRRYVPVSSRLEVMHEEQLFAQREDWVLKSDYGAEGEEVIIGKHISEPLWQKSIEMARPGRWIAQRYFEAQANAAGETINFGVFLVAGQASGIYARAQKGATTDLALSTPIFVSG